MHMHVMPRSINTRVPVSSKTDLRPQQRRSDRLELVRREAPKSGAEHGEHSPNRATHRNGYFDGGSERSPSDKPPGRVQRT